MTSTKVLQTRKPISEILAYRNENVVNRYLRDYGGTKEDAEQCFFSLMQFLALCGISSDSVNQSSEPLDHMWHTFILFTRDYREFCEIYIGRFVDHDPLGSVNKTFSETRYRAKVLFPDLDEKFWSMKSNVDCSGCGTCNGNCNVKPVLVT